MADLNELKPVGKLNPFAKFCCTIGNLPTSYMISLTYEEQLLWLCNYLEKTVIPAVNTNAEAVAELQNLYVVLKNYVDNYFDNLDVQNEINNKLDEMAQDGSLANIINQEIFTDLNTKITNLQDEINDIKTDKKTMIVIGDSFSNSAQSGTPLWYTYVSNALNLNVYTNASDGQGYGTGTNNFLKQLETANNYFTNKSIIDRIYIVGGLNDLGNTAGIPTDHDFNTVLNQVFNYATYNFPNIPIFVYGILPFQFYNFFSGDNYLPYIRATKFTEMLSFTTLGYSNIFFTNCSSFRFIYTKLFWTS